VVPRTRVEDLENENPFPYRYSNSDFSAAQFLLLTTEQPTGRGSKESFNP
jgi:hypothetical protein